jgi:hypothetical protein
MQWKALLSQSGATFIAVFLGMRFFSPTHTEFNTTLPEAFQAPLHSLEARLDKIVNMLARQQQHGSGQVGQGVSNLNLDEIQRNLRTIMATLSQLEAKDSPVPPSEPSQRGGPSAREVMPLKPPPPVNPIGWMQGLPEGKRHQVDEVFQEQAVILREKMTAASSDGFPPPDKLHIIMQENEQEVKKKLKAILNEEEYQGFLDTLPTPLAPLLKP